MTDARLSEDDETRLERLFAEMWDGFAHSYGTSTVTFLLRCIDTLKKPCAECERKQVSIDYRNGEINRLSNVIADRDTECERLRAENEALSQRWKALKLKIETLENQTGIISTSVVLDWMEQLESTEGNV